MSVAVKMILLPFLRKKQNKTKNPKVPGSKYIGYSVSIIEKYTDLAIS